MADWTGIWSLRTSVLGCCPIYLRCVNKNIKWFMTKEIPNSVGKIVVVSFKLAFIEENPPYSQCVRLRSLSSGHDLDMDHVIFTYHCFCLPSSLYWYPLAGQLEQHSLSEGNKEPLLLKSESLRIYLVTKNMNLQMKFLHPGGYVKQTKQKQQQETVGYREKNISISISIYWHLPHDWHWPPHSMCMADSHRGMLGLAGAFLSSWS